MNRDSTPPQKEVAAPAVSLVHDLTPIDGDREVRIALVLYGGVSLAIYIHGVTQELLRAVRATAPAKADPTNQAPLLEQLRPTEAIYRELGRRAGSASPFLADLDPAIHGRVHTRFVIDVISGTSAGGINGVFLAKALANDQSLSNLRTLWIKEGDVELLLNDKGSVHDLPTSIRLEKPPQALLNTRRMYYRLLEALDGVDQSNPHPKADSPLVDEIDLYVTATDIRGLVLPIPLWDRAVYERRYRNVFHFLYAAARASGEWRNDFAPENNGFLAFASRSTSSFPVAFEPMMLEDVSRVPPWNGNKRRFEADVASWRGFYQDYLRSEDGLLSSDPIYGARFLKRAFGDGGYLDNKPFSYATDELRARRTDRRVVRKLFYVEPSPEHPELDADSPDRPDPLRNLAAAGFLLPRHETIRQDIERVIERNRVIARIAEAVYRIDEDLRKGAELPLLAHGEYAESGLAKMLGRYGPGYATYHRTKVSQLTTEISEVFMRLAGLDETSGLRVAVRHLVRQWRVGRYSPDLDETQGAPRRTENEFLVEYDLGYRIRRLNFLQERLDGLLAIVGRSERRIGDDQAEQARAESSKANQAVHQALSKRLGLRREAREGERRQDLHKLSAILRGDIPVERWLVAENRPRFRAVILGLKHELAEIQVELRKQGRLIRRRGDNPVVPLIKDIVSVEELRWILATPLEDVQRERGDDVMSHPQGREERVQAAFQALAVRLNEVFKMAGKRMVDFFSTSTEPVAGDGAHGGPTIDPATIERALRKSLEAHFVRFESYDAALFTLAWGTGVGELATVDIIRVSPEETLLLREFHPRDGTRRFHKLAGTRFGNFGSFLREAWRRSDILWGRLDGAERIIRSVLVSKTDREEEFEQQFILRAQAAIVCEELEGLSEIECRRVMSQCLVRTTSGKASPELLDEMMARLLPEIEKQSPAMAAILHPRQLREFYLEKFAEERSLSPERGAPIFSRATRILGTVLDGLSDRYGPVSGQTGWWLIWIGRTVWGLVEISLPRRWGSLLVRYWMKVLYLVGAVVIVGGMLFNWPLVRTLGIRMLAALLALDLLRRLMTSLLTRQFRARTLLIPIAVLIGVAGVWTLARQIPGVEPWVDRQLTTVMDVFRVWLEPLWQLGKRLCPQC